MLRSTTDFDFDYLESSLYVRSREKLYEKCVGVLEQQYLTVDDTWNIHRC